MKLWISVPRCTFTNRSAAPYGRSDQLIRFAFRSTRPQLQGPRRSAIVSFYGQAGKRGRCALAGETPEGPGLCALGTALHLDYWQLTHLPSANFARCALNERTPKRRHDRSNRSDFPWRFKRHVHAQVSGPVLGSLSLREARRHGRNDRAVARGPDP
jgi:hypothetical protein